MWNLCLHFPDLQVPLGYFYCIALFSHRIVLMQPNRTNCAMRSQSPIRQNCYVQSRKEKLDCDQNNNIRVILKDGHECITLFTITRTHCYSHSLLLALTATRIHCYWHSLLLAFTATGTHSYSHSLLLASTATRIHCYSHWLLLAFTTTRIHCYSHSLLLVITATRIYCYSHSLLLALTATGLHWYLRSLLLALTATRTHCYWHSLLLALTATRTHCYFTRTSHSILTRICLRTGYAHNNALITRLLHDELIMQTQKSREATTGNKQEQLSERKRIKQRVNKALQYYTLINKNNWVNETQEDKTREK